MDSFVLRDDLPAPDVFRGEAPDGAALLVAVPVEPAGAAPVGVAALSGQVPELRLERLWVRPDLRGRGLGRAILEQLCTRVSAQGAVVLTARLPSTAASTALTRGAKVLGHHLTKQADPATVLPTGFGRRPMTDDEYTAWYEALVESCAQEDLPRSGGDLARARAVSRADLEDLLPDGLATPGTTVVVVTADDDRVGQLWLNHRRWRGTSFVLDLEILPERRREGWARATLALAERLTGEAGNDSVGLHVAAGNPGAQQLYASAGFVRSVTTLDLLHRENAP